MRTHGSTMRTHPKPKTMRTHPKPRLEQNLIFLLFLSLFNMLFDFA